MFDGAATLSTPAHKKKINHTVVVAEVADAHRLVERQKPLDAERLQGAKDGVRVISKVGGEFGGHEAAVLVL